MTSSDKGAATATTARDERPHRRPAPNRGWLRWRSAWCLVAVGLWEGAVAQGTWVGPPAAASPELTSETSARLLTRVQTLIGDAQCTSDADCHSIGLGARACGGPESYAAWSSAATEPETLRALVDAHRAVRSVELQAQHAASTCEIRPDPGATCVTGPLPGPGSCQLRPRGSPGSAI